MTSVAGTLNLSDFPLSTRKPVGNSNDFTGAMGVEAMLYARRLQSLKPSATVQSVAAAIVLAGGLLLPGEVVHCREYNVGTGIGAHTLELLDAGDAQSRPEEDSGNIIHVGSEGLYFKGLFDNHITLEKFGYTPDKDAGPYIDAAQAYVNTLVGDSNAITAITLDGHYRFTSEYELTGALYLDSKNASFIVQNNTFGLAIGNATTPGHLILSGALHFKNEPGSVGGGIKGVQGSFGLNSLVAQGLDGRILDCYTTQNKLNNSSVKLIKSTGSGGVRLEVTGTRGSMEVAITDYHASQSTTESLIVKNCTDASVINAVCDTASGALKDAISIYNAAGCNFGNLWGTSPDARGVVVDGDAYTNSSATYLNHFNCIGSTDSGNEIFINARACRFDMIRSIRSAGTSVRFGPNAGQVSVGALVMSDGSQSVQSTAMINASTKPIDIQTITSEGANDGAAFEITNSSNAMTIGTIQTAQALGTGANVIWASGIRPKDLSICTDADYVFKAKNNAYTVSATASFFNIPHGLSGTPQIYNVNVRNGTQPVIAVTANATNIQVTFAASVTNPQFSWQAQLF